MVTENRTVNRATLRAGLIRFGRRLREYFAAEQDPRGRVALVGSTRTRIAERLDAAERRIEAARVLREAGMPHGALILFREGGLLLAQAYLDSGDAAPNGTSPDARATTDQLLLALESGHRSIPAGFAHNLPGLLVSDSSAFDRLPVREMALRSQEADAMTRWLADVVTPRSPRLRRATRNLRLSVAILTVLAIPIAYQLWVLSPKVISVNKKVVASSQAPNTNPAGVVDDVLFGPPPFQSAPEASPWLAIDLGKRHMISDAEVFGRHDCCFDDSVPLAFEVSDDGIAYRTVATKTDTFVPLLPWVVKPLQVATRFVRLRFQRPGALVLTEVVLYGRPLP
jgi:hypothetical protein